MNSAVDIPDWSRIPSPEDDGAVRHLTGIPMPSVVLPATDGTAINLASLSGLTAIYIYPRTGKPGVKNPPGWDLMPGARGCTVQACYFRDHFQELKSLGLASLFGLSTQDSAWQREAVERLHLPFPLLSDQHLRLAHAMRLPTFQADGQTLLKRLTLLLKDGFVEQVLYPVFPPDRSAADVAAWLAARKTTLIVSEPADAKKASPAK